MEKWTALAVLIAFLLGVNSVSAEKKMKGPEPELTDEQIACVESHDCPKMEFKKGEGDFDREKMKEARECRKAAFKACDIEMPERPEHMDGDRPPRPEHMDGERPPRPEHGGKKFKKPTE